MKKVILSITVVALFVATSCKTETKKDMSVLNDVVLKAIANRRKSQEKHPDLLQMTKDFDWQLKEENIQQIYLEDNFYNFLFSNIFYHDSK